MTFTTFVAFDMCNVPRAARPTRSSASAARLFELGVQLRSGAALAQLAVIYCAPLQAIFQIGAGARDLVSICALASSALVLDTLRKTVRAARAAPREPGIDAAKQRVDKGTTPV